MWRVMGSHRLSIMGPCLSSWEKAEQVPAHAQTFADLASCVAEEGKWQALCLCKLCIGFWGIRRDAQHLSASILEDRVPVGTQKASLGLSCRLHNGHCKTSTSDASSDPLFCLNPANQLDC